MPEMLDIVDENGVPAGQERAAHRRPRRGAAPPHQPCLDRRRRKAGRVQVLLQTRCAAKDSYPGC